MAMATRALEQIETRLPKVIDARTHGVIDYAHVAFFLSMALICRKKNPPAALAALLTASGVLVEALLTDYPLGVWRKLPFAVHGQLDSGFAASSYFGPKLFGFEGTTASAVFKANAVVEATAIGLTDFNSARAHDDAI